jgi:hypothetical protein
MGMASKNIGGFMKGFKQLQVKEPTTLELMEKERLKKIMNKPVTPRATSLYWMSLGRFRISD